MAITGNPVKLLLPIFFILLFVADQNGSAAQYFEQSGEYSAADVFKPEMTKGRYHQVSPKVAYDGFRNMRAKRAASITAEMVRQGIINEAAGFEIWTLGTFSEHARTSLKTLGVVDP